MAVIEHDIFTGLKVIDVDAHISEPADLWTSRLPAKWQDKGPRVIRQKISGVRMIPPGLYEIDVDEENGTPADCWLYEDRIVYVQKSHVAIPMQAVPNGAVCRKSAPAPAPAAPDQPRRGPKW